MRKRTYPAGNDAASRSRKAGRHLCSPSAVCGSAHNVGGQFVPSSQAALQKQYPHLSQQKVVAGTGAFFLLSRSSERRFFHEVRSQHPLQNLPGRECASAELIQRICRHEGEVRAAAQSGHRKVHDGRRPSGAFCDGLVQQELSNDTWKIPISQEIQDFYKMHRPSPLVQAYCSRRSRRQPGRIP